MELARTARELFAGPSREFGVRLWEGTLLPPARENGVRGLVALRRARALHAFVPPISEQRLAEAFLDGDLEIEGDIVGVLESAGRWEGPQLRASLARAIAAVLVQRALARTGTGSFSAPLAAARHSLVRDRSAVRHHYDVSDDFYRLFLDSRLVYSSAYFARGDESLEQAQEAKLDLICRKLGLERGERLLDVGCGWGAFLVHAAEHYRVDGLGITLSKNQLAEAQRRLAQAPDGARVTAAAADYRTLRAPERFHKVASIGMMEHVGRGRLDRYFLAIHRLMHPGGLFLNQAIADVSSGVTTLPWASRRGGGFIARYIFPDSDLVPLGQVVAAAQRSGFEVRDVESLREHYAATLEAWLRRLEARLGEAHELVGERRTRAYRLYLASSAAAFRLGRISVFQLLLAKPSSTGRAEGLPRCRAHWYVDRGGAASPRRDGSTQREPGALRGAGMEDRPPGP